MVTVALVLFGFVVALAAYSWSWRNLEKSFLAFSTVPPALFFLALISEKLQGGYVTLVPLSLSLVLSFLMLVFAISLMISRARKQASFRGLLPPALIASIPTFYAIIRESFKMDR